MKALRREKGTISTMMAIMLPVGLAATGLVVDLGRMHSFKREMQNAADAAAISAAQEWRQQNFTSYDEAAVEDAALNGFDEADGAEVEIHVPPTQGFKAGDMSFLEVIIRQPAPMYFMRVFRSEAQMVETRAVAGLMPHDACLYVLDPHSSGALSIAGQASVTLHDCGVQVNSDSSSAATSSGTAQLTATGVAVVGNYTGTGYFPTPVTGVVPSPDPLAYLQPPPNTSCTFTERQVLKTEITISPGVYCGGLEITAQGRVTMQPGVYVIKGGGLKTQAGSYVQGDGVMIYNTGAAGYTWDAVDFHAGSESHLTPPTSGEYRGILFFNDRSITASTLNVFAGTPATEFKGVIYFANTNVRFTGDSEGAVHNMVFVANKVEFQGNAYLEAYNIGRDLLPAGLAVARIVE